MIGVPKTRTQLSLTEYSRFVKGTMKEQTSPFSSLISSFVWPLVSFFLLFQRHASNSSDSETNLWVFLLWRLWQFAVTAWHEVLMTNSSWGWGGGWRGSGEFEVPRGHDLTCLPFCSYALAPAERRLTNPMLQRGCTQCLDSTLSLLAVHKDRLCLCYSDKSSGSLAESSPNPF